MLNTIIVDSNALTRIAVRSILERNNISVIAESDSGLHAINLAEQLSPDLIIIDINLSKISGIEVIEILRKKNFNKPIIATAIQNDMLYGKMSSRVGANGFIRKQDFESNIINGINATLNGYCYFPSSVLKNTDDLNHEQSMLSSLSNQEIKVMKILLNGSRNKEVAFRMGISDRTVSTYKKRLLIKLGCNSTLDLFKFAERNEL